MSKPTFTIDDGVEYSTTRIPPLAKKAIDLLSSLPLNKLLTKRGLAMQIGCSHERVTDFRHMLEPYRTKDGNRYLYGNPKTLKALNEQKG